MYDTSGVEKNMKNLVKIQKPHISINVSNLTESVEFYKKLFAAEPVKLIERSQADPGRRGYAKFDLDEPALNFVMNEVPHSSRGTLSHLGFQVASTDDVLAVRSQWLKAGLATDDQMNVDCCYALQDKTWTRDPDGNEWEVFTVLGDTAPGACGTNTAVEDTAATSCCTEESKPTNIATTSARCC